MNLKFRLKTSCDKKDLTVQKFKITTKPIFKNNTKVNALCIKNEGALFDTPS